MDTGNSREHNHKQVSQEINDAYDENVYDDEYQIHLESFEGPMDLLVYLIKKNQVNIYDIPIAFITDQYLGYLELMKSMNIDFAGDFLVMASTLTQIKSKMLLPIHEDDEDAEDPRLEIARPIEEYLMMKSAAEQLSQRNLLGEITFTRAPVKERIQPSDNDEMVHVGLFELIDAFKKILEKVSAEHRVDLTSEKISLKERISQIIDILEEKESAAFEELFCAQIEKIDIVITFLAILEMVKLGLINILQHQQSGIIRVFYQ